MQPISDAKAFLATLFFLRSKDRFRQPAFEETKHGRREEERDEIRKRSIRFEADLRNLLDAASTERDSRAASSERSQMRVLISSLMALFHFDRTRERSYRRSKKRCSSQVPAIDRFSSSSILRDKLTRAACEPVNSPSSPNRSGGTIKGTIVK